MGNNIPTSRTILKAFAFYDLGDVNGDPQYIKGDINLNYKISTDKNSYLLKYVVEPSDIPQFEFLGALHEYLRNKGIAVPNIFKTKHNTYVENSFILYEFIDGVAKKEWTKEEIISLVENFTKLLIALKEFPVPELIRNKKDKYINGGDIKYCTQIFKPQIISLSTSDEIKKPIIDTIDHLYPILPEFENLPKQLIHGDLNETNALFKNGRVAGIIDLALSWDPTVYDLGEFCYWYAFPWWTKKFDHERFQLITETFQKSIPLSRLEIQLLPYMILRRSLMDMMVTLQYYWSSPQKINLPEKRLREQIQRNNEIIKLIHP